MQRNNSLTPVLRRIHEILPLPFAWCEIPAGSVVLQHADGAPGGAGVIQKFYIGRYPITEAQFNLFLQHATMDHWAFSPQAIRAGMTHPLTYDPDAAPDHPRVNVTWYDAVAFTRWLNGVLRLQPPLQIRLPTEHEWQFAAQGVDKWPYPWGLRFDPARCNTREGDNGQLAPVTDYANGESPFHMRQAAGNVREWCINPRGENTGRLGTIGPRALRGGSFQTSAAAAKVTARAFAPPHTKAQDLGFRIVLAAFHIR